MMGRQTVDQSQLFYLFNLEGRIPARHLLRRINPIVTRILGELREKLEPFYSEIGRPSIDPELMIRMLIVGYCYGIRFERKLCEEVELHLAYRWFCRLDLDDKVPDHSTFSVNRHGRFRDSDMFRQVFEAVVRACMDAGLVKGEGFAVDASVMEADASRYHGKAPDEIDWSVPERQTRAVAEFLGALDDDDPNADRKLPKVISPIDPCSAWTAKANKRVQFGYGLNYLIDIENAVIVDVEATPARTYDEVAATKTMIERTEQTPGLEARTARGRHGLRDRQVPRLARRHRHHAADSGVGQEQSRGRNLLTQRLHVRSRAQRLRLSRGQAAQDHGQRRRRPHDALSGIASAIAAHAHSSRNAVRTRPRARSHATSTRMPAIMPARFVGTPEFERSRDERKKVEMRFAHLKTHHRFERMRLRGLSGARDEFHLAAIVQNLKTLAKHIWRPRPHEPAACAA